MFSHLRFPARPRSEFRCRAMRPDMCMPLALILNPPRVIGRLSALNICHLRANVRSLSPRSRAYSSRAALAADFALKSITQSSMYLSYDSTFMYDAICQSISRCTQFAIIAE